MEYWKYQASQMLRRMSPADFEATPIYLVSRRTLDERFDVGSEKTLAYTSPYLDVQLQPVLEGRNEWCGRGFAAVFYEHRFADGIDDTERRATLITLHEACHRFDKGRVSEDLDAAFVQHFQQQHVVAPESIAEPLKDAVRKRPWCQHDHRFIRMALHVSHRTGIPAELLWDRELYGLSPIDQYAQHLGDEPEQRRAESLYDISESDMPLDFSAFAWLDQQAAEERMAEEKVGSSGA